MLLALQGAMLSNIDDEGANEKLPLVVTAHVDLG
jgi:hypothetical protein